MELIDAFIILPFFIILCFGIILIRKDIAEIKELIDKKIMKKLSVEEKAKAYDEALEKLRSLYDDYDTVSTLIDIKEELEHIFPELAESEDERIRNGLIKYFRAGKCENVSSYHGISTNDILAWLEKQAEQKPVDVRTTGYWNVQDIEQKPAWSEEDETMITDLSVIVHTYFSEISGISFKYDLSEDKIRTWLNSIKDRVQPKQEWKPSGEQMEFVWKYAEQNNYDGKVFTRLYNDLKKLKGE